MYIEQTKRTEEERRHDTRNRGKGRSAAKKRGGERRMIAADGDDRGRREFLGEPYECTRARETDAKWHVRDSDETRRERGGAAQAGRIEPRTSGRNENNRYVQRDTSSVANGEGRPSAYIDARRA